jgi:hypothetical protein
LSNFVRLFIAGFILAGLFLSLPGSAANSSNSVLIDLAAKNLTPDEQLALKYAPIAYLRTQTNPCDTVGEPYSPTAVNVSFSNALIKLCLRTDAKKAKDDSVAVEGRTEIRLPEKTATPPSICPAVRATRNAPMRNCSMRLSATNRR